MKAAAFPEANVIYAKDQPQYKPLPAFKDENGICVSRWKLSFREKLRILFKGEIWISAYTFNKPLTPILPTTKKSDVLITIKNDKPRHSNSKKYSRICFVCIKTDSKYTPLLHRT